MKQGFAFARLVNGGFDELDLVVGGDLKGGIGEVRHGGESIGLRVRQVGRQKLLRVENFQRRHENYIACFSWARGNGWGNWRLRRDSDYLGSRISPFGVQCLRLLDSAMVHLFPRL
jgi:hypothetical protein